MARTRETGWNFEAATKHKHRRHGFHLRQMVEHGNLIEVKLVDCRYICNAKTEKLKLQRHIENLQVQRSN
eukprot:m.193720 g.193720  ORF g.193720 m.193720 type:complete len:70 (-) comp32516_c0_seq2:382-591(-)